MPKVEYTITTINWDDLDGEDLRIHVSHDEETGLYLVYGISKNRKEVYLLEEYKL